MNKPIYISEIHMNLHCNIEMLRDACEVLSTDCMVNAYGQMAWGITNGARLCVKIAGRRHDTDKNVLCEFQGDGIVTVVACDSYGTPVEEDYLLFDTHWIPGNKDTAKEFRERVYKRFGVRW